MNRDNYETLKQILADTLGLDEDEILLASNFYLDLGADDLDLVEIVMDLESEFDIEIPDEEMATCENYSQTTVQTIVDMLDRCLARAGR